MHKNYYERAKSGACAIAILTAHPEIEAGNGQSNEEMRQCEILFSQYETEWYSQNTEWLPDDHALMLYPQLAYLLNQ